MEDQILTEHFMLSEFTRSSIAIANGIDNTIPASLIPNLKNLCQEVLEPLRQQAGAPVIISSGYRCPELNQLAGGAPDSQHLTGEAADIILPPTLNLQPSALREWYRILADGAFDQLIMESKGNHYWIHVSCRPNLSDNRQQAFRLKK